MAINLEASFATVVHSAPPRARLEASFASIVHSAPPRARLEASFASVVHGAALPPPPPPPVLLRRSQLRMLVEGVQPPPAPYTAQARVRPIALNREIGYGSDAYSFDVLHSSAGTISSGGSITVDLLTDGDAFGVAMDLADVALVLVQSPAASVGTVLVRAAASSGWVNLLATGADLRVGPGTTMVMLALEPGQLNVAAGNSALELAATGGDAQYELVIWGRRN